METGGGGDASKQLHDNSDTLSQVFGSGETNFQTGAPLKCAAALQYRN